MCSNKRTQQNPNSLINLKSKGGFKLNCVPWNKGIKKTTNTGKTHFKKGHTAWNKGKKGIMPIPWNKGIKKATNTGNTHFKKGYIPWNKGLKGVTKAWNKGLKGVTKAWNKGKPNYEIRGKNHPNWKGGKGRHDNERKRFECLEWRKNVFKRDNWRCQWCGDKRKKNNRINVEAHHIKTWNNYPELRYDLNNGITLCYSCHQKTKTKEKDFENLFKELLKNGFNSVELSQETIPSQQMK